MKKVILWARMILVIAFIVVGCYQIYTVLVPKGGPIKSSQSSSSVAEISEDDYKAECQTVDYKELCRYPDKYAGTKVTVKVQVKQIMDESTFSSKKVWRAFDDGDTGLEWYLSNEYYMVDKRQKDSVRILEDDIITVYGEFSGEEKVTRALTSTTDELPRIEVKYADLVEE